MIEPYSRIFSDWYQKRSTNTGNWGFDIEEAAKEAFQVGIRVSYEPMKEIMYDVATTMGIKVMQKEEEDTFLAVIEIDGKTKGAVGKTAPESIYGLVRAISRDEKFTKLDDLNGDERERLGLS